ncbi:MAG: hypothetical protein LUI09_01495, partial [Prevotellaceae bacterium]|nr:hypothetical protein [Prevotellaceae bacterium]
RIMDWWRRVTRPEPQASDLEGRTVFVARFDDSDLDGSFRTCYGKVVRVWGYGIYVFIGLDGECLWLKLEEVEALQLLKEGRLTRRFGDIRYQYTID